MKPFNLQEAQAGKPLQFENGAKVTLVSYVPEANADEQVVLFARESKMIVLRDIYGRCTLTGARPIFMASTVKRMQGWIVRYLPQHFPQKPFFIESLNGMDPHHYKILKQIEMDYEDD